MALIMIVSAMAVLFTGCIRSDMTLTVRKTGNVDVSFLFATSTSLQSFTDVDTQFDVDKLRNGGWTITDYYQDGYSGILAEKKNMSPTSYELKSFLNMYGSNGDSSSVSVTGNTISLDIPVFESDSFSEVPEMAGVIRNAGGSLSMTINLPIKPKEHNATYVSSDGKSLTWDLLSMNPNQHIYLEATKPNGSMLIIIGVAAVLLLIVLVAVLKGRKKLPQPAENETE